jgi:hypothetical protein
LFFVFANRVQGASFMTPKGQTGIPEQQQDWFEKTSLNPVILDAAGTLFSFMQLPWLAQLPPSSTTLRGLGLNASVSSYSDGNATRTRAITDLCTAGASGDEAAAVQCLDVWQRELIPAKQRQMDRVRNILDDALPNYDANGKPFSGELIRYTRAQPLSSCSGRYCFLNDSLNDSLDAL